MSGPAAGPLLRVEDLKVWFPITEGIIREKHIGDVRAIDGVSFDMARGETLGLVGESGCGKTTTGRAIIRLYQPTAGRIDFAGTDIAGLQGKALRQMRRRMQMIFQDPYSSLNPRMNVAGIVGEPLEIHEIGTKTERHDRVRDLLATVGLNPDFGERYPHEFSGGQRQRIALASALASDPELIILDEPVSALDVSIRAQIMNLLKDLQEQRKLAYLLVAHNLATVRYIAHRTAVMYLGRIVEYAETEALFQNPRHPYTKALFAAALPADPDATGGEFVLTGEVPSPIDPPSGCRFHPRCPFVKPECSSVDPVPKLVASDQVVACHLY